MPVHLPVTICTQVINLMQECFTELSPKCRYNQSFVGVQYIAGIQCQFQKKGLTHKTFADTFLKAKFLASDAELEKRDYAEMILKQKREC